MKYLGYIFIAMLMLSSCMKQDSYMNEDDMVCILKGKTTDPDGTGIEHIRITISYDGSEGEHSYYSGTGGKFLCEFPLPEISGELTINIILEDIDGTDNGGEFSSMTHKVTLFENDYIEDPGHVIIDMQDCRLSHATASENIPQS